MLLGGVFGFVVPVAESTLWPLVGLGVGLLLGGMVFWRVPIEQVRRAWREGELGDHDVSVISDASGVEIRRGPSRRRVGWSAVRRIADGTAHVFVDLAHQSVAVPRWALGDRARQAAYVAQLRNWISVGEAALPLVEPPPGRDTRRLAYRLVYDDYVMFARAMHAEHLRRRTLGLVLMGVLVAGVLLTSAEPWRGGFDQGLVGLMAIFSGSLVLLGLAPVWYPRLFTAWQLRRSLQRAPELMPVGPVVLAVGPDGGWMYSAEGAFPFHWPDVQRVYSDADLVVLALSDQEGVVVPSRAFQPATDQDAFVQDVEIWSEKPPEPKPVATPEVESPSRPPDLANPFEPPKAH